MHWKLLQDLEREGFTRLPPGQWRSARTTNAIERLHEEFKRRIKTQTVLPSADTAAMLFWALLASGLVKNGDRLKSRRPTAGDRTRDQSSW
jgi:transposase-like protein